MIEVYLLTPEEAQSLIGAQFIPDNYFNPIQDDDGNWIISQQEVDQCSIEWVKLLPLITYKPKLWQA